MNTKTTLILKQLFLLITVFFSSTLLSQTVVTVTDCNLNGWERQPLAGTTVEFSAVPPKPLLGNGSLRFHHPTATRIIRVRSQHYHDTLLSSLTEFRYSTYIESRENNVDNVLFVMLVDKTADGIVDDYLIFETKHQTGKWVEGKVPDQGPTVLRKWQTWDMLKGIWWFGPAPPAPKPENGGELFSFEDYVRKNPSARIFNPQPAGSAGGIRLNVGEPQPATAPSFGAGFEGYADAFTVGVNGNTTIYDFEPGIANAGADTMLTPGSNCVMLQGTGAGGVGPYSYAWTGGGVNSNSQTIQFCPTANTTYTLTVTDSKGCVGTDEVAVITNAVLPVTFTDIKASQRDKSIQVHWTVANESNILKYQVERSSDAINFINAGEVAAKGSSSTQNYYWLDKDPGQANNYYRIKSMQADGRFSYTKTLIVKLNGGQQEIKLVANPVTNQRLNLYFNDIQKGNYTLQLKNSAGQQIFTKIIDHPGGSSNQIISLYREVPAGVYYLQVVSKTTPYVKTIVIE